MMGIQRIVKMPFGTIGGTVALVVSLFIQSCRLVDAQFEIKELYAQAARSQQDTLDRIKRCMESKGGAQ